MATALRKIVVFLSLIAFTLSSIIGLAGGIEVTAIIYRSLIVLVAFVIIGMSLIPIFIKMWGEDTQETMGFDEFPEEEKPENELK